MLEESIKLKGYYRYSPFMSLNKSTTFLLTYKLPNSTCLVSTTSTQQQEHQTLKPQVKQNFLSAPVLQFLVYLVWLSFLKLLWTHITLNTAVKGTSLLWNHGRKSKMQVQIHLISLDINQNLLYCQVGFHIRGMTWKFGA